MARRINLELFCQIAIIRALAAPGRPAPWTVATHGRRFAPEAFPHRHHGCDYLRSINPRRVSGPGPESPATDRPAAPAPPESAPGHARPRPPAPRENCRAP